MKKKDRWCQHLPYRRKGLKMVIRTEVQYGEERRSLVGDANISSRTQNECQSRDRGLAPPYPYPDAFPLPLQNLFLPSSIFSLRKIKRTRLGQISNSTLTALCLQTK